jgi:hypothetical protein
MKNLLLQFIFLAITTFSYSQTEDAYDSDWYNSLSSELECFIFPNPTDVDMKVRVYRGNSNTHSLKMYNTLSKEVLSLQFDRDVDVDISYLESGIYYVEISNDKKNVYEIIMVK